MALRRAAQLLPRLAGSTQELVTPLSRLSFGNTDVQEHLPTPYAKAMAQWRVYASDVQVQVDQKVGAIANTPTGLPPTAHLKANPSHMVTYDEANHERFPVGDPNKRAFTYFVLTGARFMYASAMRLVVLKFLLSWAASADVLAMAALEVDLNTIKEGNTMTVKWRGKPVFVKHRTDVEIEREQAVKLSDLRDPETDAARVQDPKWVVCLGVCTHLGCVPVSNAGDYHGWFCPCHGSHYDGSGRIRRGPAPYNLEVPEYKFLDDDTLVIG
eukprot:jgi/Ulvmu1/7189/UM034_0098.1